MNGWNDLHKLILSDEFDQETFYDYKNFVNIPTSTGSSPLHLAVIEGNQQIIIFLIQHGAKLNYQNQDGQTALHWACKAGRTSIVKLLLKTGADIEIKDNEGNTPLHWAAEYNSHRVIRVLKAKGAKSSLNLDRRSPFDVAVDNMSKKAKNLLRRSSKVGCKV
mmetsp:Transcript_62148/g.93842  ORF Transcript_62148/g.93842 Transcript_62148/m.93842 type:complete len:163 (-) Transcript_62148:53-541(-)